MDSFNDKESEFKLYFLIFLAEHNPTLLDKYSKGINLKGHINIFKFLSNPTAENADRAELGINSANAYIIQFLKSEVIKGISLDYAYNVKWAFEAITDTKSQLKQDKIQLRAVMLRMTWEGSEQMVSQRRLTTLSNVAKISLRKPLLRSSFHICSMGFISGV